MLQNCALGQRSSPPPIISHGSAPPTQTLVTLQVNIREETGAPLQAGAFVKLSSDFNRQHVTATTQDASTAPNVMSGEYDLEVEAPGYRTATEHASIMAAGSDFTVYVYMHRIPSP